MDWDDITSPGAGAKPGRVTCSVARPPSSLRSGALCRRHRNVVLAVLYPLAPLLVAFGWLGAWTCSLFFRQWALFVKRARADEHVRLLPRRRRASASAPR